MRLAVEGMACLGSFGGSLAALHRPPGPEEQGAQQADRILACGPQADTGRLAEYFSARTLRQMDHFTRMALLCACDALADADHIKAGAPTELPANTGIVLVSGYGPASPTFDFLDSILGHGELMASPLSFSHSVHNIPAAHIAMKLNTVGPCLSLCQLECPVTAGLLVASAWLAEGRVTRVLFGAVDEHTPLLAHISGCLSEERRAQGKHPGRSALFLGEGAAFFVLATDTGAAKHGFLSRASMQMWTDKNERLVQKPEDAHACTLLSGMIPAGLAALQGTTVLAARYGNIPVAQAFDAAFSLSAPPVAGEIRCLAFGSQGQAGSFYVEASKTKNPTGSVA